MINEHGGNKRGPRPAPDQEERREKAREEMLRLIADGEDVATRRAE